MSNARITLFRLLRADEGRKGVAAAEFAILAVGVIVTAASAVVLFDLNNPMLYAGSILASSQSSLIAGSP